VYADEVTIAQAFEDQARRTPEAIALSEGTHTLSYRDLDRRANDVARALIEKGVRPEMPVAVYMKRSIDAIVALLGVLKVGSPHVPLDTSQPKYRLHLLVASCDCRIVLTNRALTPDLPEMELVLLDADMTLWADQIPIPPLSHPSGVPAYGCDAGICR
jgi:non-ribosomal peptide synthetase component F